MGDVEVHALRSVNLELYEGELLVLLGASGSGKSTLLNILGGLDVPTSPLSQRSCFSFYDPQPRQFLPPTFFKSLNPTDETIMAARVFSRA